MDSGIQADHPHFVLHRNIDSASPYHVDFTDADGKGDPLTDPFGHGTHVAGIIAGEQSIEKKSDPKKMVAAWRELDENQQEESKQASLETIFGMAPECQLVSLKVLDRFGQGSANSFIAALCHVQEINHHGRELRIHGVNLSLGYPFEAKWFACGHSPLCVEVKRLVKSGVIVVIAAGNSGYGTLRTKEGDSDATLELTINDPGNAEYAITVGSTTVTCRTCTVSPTFVLRGPPVMVATSPICLRLAKGSSLAPRRKAGWWSKKPTFPTATTSSKAVRAWPLLM
jgi:subtilisin family serine protease